MTLRQTLQLIDAWEGVEVIEAYKYTTKSIMTRDHRSGLIRDLEDSKYAKLLDHNVKFIDSGWSKDWSWIRVYVDHYTDGMVR